MKKKDVCTAEMCAGGRRPTFADAPANVDIASSCTSGQAMAFASEFACHEFAHHCNFWTPLVTVYTFVIALHKLLYTATNYCVGSSSLLDEHRFSKNTK